MPAPFVYVNFKRYDNEIIPKKKKKRKKKKIEKKKEKETKLS